MQIRNVVFARRPGTQHTFPVQARVLEIYKECQIQACDVQIADHLRNVRLGKA